MNQIRGNAIQKAKDAMLHMSNCTVGIIMGTLGRQGNPAIVQRIKEIIQEYNRINHTTIRHFLMLLSEISPTKLNLFQKKIHVWIQIACPRLSIDWGHYLTQNHQVPVLNPYEFFCCFNSDLLWYNPEDDHHHHHEDNSIVQEATPSFQSPQQNKIRSYPMDYYSTHGGPWSNYHQENKSRTIINNNSEKECNLHSCHTNKSKNEVGCTNCSCQS
jgi:2-(3-amino-3-carboxypropyl)histidine synthase